MTKNLFRILTASVLTLTLVHNSASAGTITDNRITNGNNGPVTFGSNSANGGTITDNRRTNGNNGPVTQGLQGPCIGQKTIIHENGGGKVATTASVAPSVYVSADRAVCGRAVVSGPTRLTNSVVNDAANISGQSTLTGATMNGTSAVSDSTVSQSVLNGGSKVSRSQVMSSTLNGQAAVENASVTGSVLNGRHRSSAAMFKT